MLSSEMLFSIYSKLSKRQLKDTVDIVLVTFFLSLSKIKVIVPVSFTNSELLFIVLVFFLQVTLVAFIFLTLSTFKH